MNEPQCPPLPFDPGHVMTRTRLEAMVRELEREKEAEKQGA
jgi:hypothetical protein